MDIGFFMYLSTSKIPGAWFVVFLVNGTQLTPSGTAILLSLSTGSDAFATRGSAIPYFYSPSFCAF